MYDIPELEKKWRKYRRNRIRKPIIIALSTVAIIGGASYFGMQYLSNSPKKLESNNSKKEIVKQQVPNQNTQVVKQQKQTVSNQQQQLQQQQQQQQQQAPLVNPPQIEQQSQTPAIVITKVPKNEMLAKDTVVSTPKSVAKPRANGDDTIDLTNAEVVNLNVPEEETRIIGFNRKEKKNIKNKYQDLLETTPNNKALKERAKIAIYEERFKSTQDPKDSLYLAKYYYKKGNYEKAETWAVNTNNVDGDIEDSWIIFAKARAKQGHRVDAIKVLQSYYDETNSPRAKVLLDKLRRNKPFK
jgi:tetratricopeptide (TPR) repeat protein